MAIPTADSACRLASRPHALKLELLSAEIGVELWVSATISRLWRPATRYGKLEFLVGDALRRMPTPHHVRHAAVELLPLRGRRRRPLGCAAVLALKGTPPADRGNLLLGRRLGADAYCPMPMSNARRGAGNRRASSRGRPVRTSFRKRRHRVGALGFSPVVRRRLADRPALRSSTASHHRSRRQPLACSWPSSSPVPR